MVTTSINTKTRRTNVNRYSKEVGKARKRELVLLKGKPCIWGKCTFCDYIDDNSLDEEESYRINAETLRLVTGEFKALEVINSGSVFELGEKTLLEIKRTVEDKGIELLYFESYYAYRKRLGEIREYFGIPIIFKCGIETFDDDFRNKILNKGIHISSISDVSDYFDSICLLVGIKGQTKEMISRDVDILIKNFRYGCVNVYNDNSTPIKADKELIKWFDKEYGDMLRSMENVDYLINNTDFGVGEI